MNLKKFSLALLLLLAGVACSLGRSSGDGPEAPTLPLEVARFHTATPTDTPNALPQPDTPTPIPPTETPVVETPTVTPTATAEMTPSPSPTAIGAQAAGAPAALAGDTITLPATPTIPPPPPTPTDTATPEPPPLPSGRIVFPVDDGGGHYDIWAVELPDGEPFFVMDRARQPSFSPHTGQLLVNHESSPRGEHIGLIDRDFTWLGLVSDTPEDEYPTWDPGGGRYAYGNPILLQEPLTQNSLPFIFVPCSLRRPMEEPDQKCRDTSGMSKLVAGAYPVWTDDGRIAFYNFRGDRGLYVISADSTPRRTGGVEPHPQLVLPVIDARPSDVSGLRLYFSTSNLDGNWEAYAINLDGSGLTNLSNSSDSNDGLPAASPDGRWVAFVSDRGEQWAIWIVSSAGGEPQKLVDLPVMVPNPSPWGQGDHDWTRERITWGPDM